MVEKSPKDKSVLGALPAERPERIGVPRRGAAKPKHKPRAVSPGAAALSCTHEPPPPKPIEPPRGTELVTTAIRATGELAQIGLTLGGRAVKRALRR
jgi:hypothetical protein